MKGETRRIYVAEMRRTVAALRERIEEQGRFRQIVGAWEPADLSCGGQSPESLWLLAAIDNRRVELLDKIAQTERAIEIEEENAREESEDAARDELGVLFINGERV